MVSRLLEKTAGVVYVNEIPIEEWNENELAKTLAILKQDNNVGMHNH